MDTRTCDVILKKILDMSNNTPNYKLVVHYDELEKIFGFSSVEVQSALSRLQDQGNIKVRFFKKENTIYVYPTYDGIGYFQRKQEIEREKRKEQRSEHKNKWSERNWALFLVVLAAILAFIFGIFNNIIDNWFDNHLNKSGTITASPTISPTLNHTNTQINSPTIHKK